LASLFVDNEEIAKHMKQFKDGVPIVPIKKGH